jgi:predicted PurR-regulated permease PerM
MTVIKTLFPKISMKILLLLITCVFSLPAVAVEVAPRISDREIIESLAELKAGQRALEERMDQRFTAMQEQMNLRFTVIDQRFATMQTQIDQRFDFLQQLILVLIAGIFGLIGFVVWDRFSTLRPMDARLRRIEQDLEHDLDMQSPEGSKLTRMIHALRELAKEDKKVEAVMRSFSLL